MAAGLVRTAATAVSSSLEDSLRPLRQHGDGPRRRKALGVAPKSDKADVLPALGALPARRATTAVRHLLPAGARTREEWRSPPQNDPKERT
jgi:hypothetical protein